MVIYFVFGGCKNSKPAQTKYYLNIPDSPKVKGVWLEIDYISSDTAYCNWYSNGK